KESLRLSIRTNAEDEHRRAVRQLEERVGRHHETAARLVAPPLPGNSLQLRPAAGLELAGALHHPPITPPPHPLHPLPPLPPLPHGRLLGRDGAGGAPRRGAVIGRPSPGSAVGAEPQLGGAEDRDPPVARPRKADEVPDELIERARVANRVAGDDRDTADD